MALFYPTTESPLLRYELKLLHEKVYLQLKALIEILKEGEEKDTMLLDLDKAYLGK